MPVRCCEAGGTPLHGNGVQSRGYRIQERKNPADLSPANPPFTLTGTSGGLYAIFQVFPHPSVSGAHLLTLEAFVVTNGSAFIDVPSGTGTLTFTLSGGSMAPMTVHLGSPHGYNHFHYGPSEIPSAREMWQVHAPLVQTNGTAVDFFDVPIH